MGQFKLTHYPWYHVGMFVTTIPNRNSPPTYLLRESVREGDKVRSRTLANLTKLPLEQVELIRRVLKGERLLPADSFEVQQTLPHGHVAAVLGTISKLGLAGLLHPRKGPERQLCLAMIADRILRSSRVGRPGSPSSHPTTAFRKASAFAGRPTPEGFPESPSRDSTGRSPTIRRALRSGTPVIESISEKLCPAR